MIAELAVKAEARGQRIGRMLLQECEAFVKNAKSINLRTEVLASNEVALRLHRKAGFGNHLVMMKIRLESHR